MKIDKHILIVDDDMRLRGLLKKFLSSNGYYVDSAVNAKEARKKIKEIFYDIIILDVMMPGEDGMSLAKSIRLKNNIPILMLTAMGEVKNRIAGLEIGADDYLPKPFEPKELLLRISAILRRKNYKTDDANRDLVFFGHCIYNKSSKALSFNQRKINLTQHETLIISALSEFPELPVAREKLALKMSVTTRTIDVIVSRLRKKITKETKVSRNILTVRGIGYRLSSEQ